MAEPETPTHDGANLGAASSDVDAQDAYAHHRAELDLTAGMKPQSAWRAGGILVLLVVSLAALYPEGVVNVAQSLPPHALTDPLIPAAYAWQDWMSVLGIVDVYEAVREGFRGLRGQ